ncbi:MAG: hypothetical protein IT462_08655 [Planctomycetes bacterium]|nr:hypothetical protein [Planctomycetota bacterium]
MRLLPVLFALMFAAPLIADDAHVKNAQDWLKTQTSINESVCRTGIYAFSVGGMNLGSGTFTIGKSTFDDQPCYLITVAMDAKLGPKGSFGVKSESYVSHDLRVLYGSNTETENGKESNFTSVTFSEGKYAIVMRKDGKPTKKTVDASPGLLLAGSQMIAGLLLPLDKQQSYEFEYFREKDGAAPYTITVGAKEKFKDAEAIKMTTTRKAKAGDDVNEFWVSADLAMLCMQGVTQPMKLELVSENDGAGLDFAKVRKLERAVDAVLLWWAAVLEADAEMAAECMDTKKIAESIVRRMPDAAKMSAEQTKIAVDGIAKDMCKNLTSSGKSSMPKEALGDGCFSVTMDGDSKATITLSDGFQKLAGGGKQFTFRVEWYTDGKWKVVDFEMTEKK